MVMLVHYMTTGHVLSSSNHFALLASGDANRRAEMQHFISTVTLFSLSADSRFHEVLFRSTQGQAEF